MQIILLKILQNVGRLYGLIQAIRAHMYTVGILATYRPSAPVISVGNITAGGTGKTPMVIWLAGYLQKRGKKVAVVSRGYRQLSKKPVTMVSDQRGLLSSPPEAADEAVLIAKKLPGVVVITGPDRRQTIDAAIRQYGCNLIIMDDALQHLRVKRDLNLVLVDSRHPLANGHMLPGGLLREFPPALNRGDGFIITRADQAEYREKTEQLLKKIAPGKPITHAIHRPSGWLAIGNDGVHPQPLPMEHLQNIPVLAFCGIAKPASFRQTLNDLTMDIQIFKSFADHHPFDVNTITDLVQQAITVRAQALVCTEKDAVKIFNSGYELPIYALAMELHFPDPSDWLPKQLANLPHQ